MWSPCVEPSYMHPDSTRRPSRKRNCTSQHRTCYSYVRCRGFIDPMTIPNTQKERCLCLRRAIVVRPSARTKRPTPAPRGATLGRTSLASDGQNFLGRFSAEIGTQHVLFSWSDIQEFRAIPTDDYRYTKAKQVSLPPPPSPSLSKERPADGTRKTNCGIV